MGFTTNYGVLMMALARKETADIVADDGNPYTVIPQQADFKMYAKMALGIGVTSINPNDFKLNNEVDRQNVTESGITVSGTEVFESISTIFNQGGSRVLTESGIFADVKDALDNLYAVLIRRDLLPTPFTTTPSTDYTSTYKVSQSLLI